MLSMITKKMTESDSASVVFRSAVATGFQCGLDR